MLQFFYKLQRLALIQVLIFSFFAYPATNIWDSGGGATTTWSTGSNWNPDGAPVFAAGDIFNLSNLNIAASSTSTMDSSNTLGTIQIGDTNNTHSWNLTGTGTLTLDGNGASATISQINTSKGDTISITSAVLNSNLTLSNADADGLTISTNLSSNTAGAKTITNSGAGAGNVTLSGVLADGSGSLAVTQNSTTSTLILSGANTFTGTTTVTAGTLNIQNSLGLGSTAGATTVASGAQLQLQGGVTITGESLTIVGTGVGFLGALNNGSGNNTWAGNISVSSAASTFMTSNSGTLLVTGNLALSPTASDTLTLNGNGNGNISGVISGTSNISRRSTAGNGVWTLSGANTYTGKTSVDGGTLSVSSINSVAGGTATSNMGAPTTVANGTINFGTTVTSGTLIYTGSGETTDRVLNLAGTTGGATIDQSGSGTLKFTSNLTATGAGAKTVTLQGSTSGNGEIAGAIIDSGGGATSLNKSGSNTWTLSGANTATGPATIDGGKLIIGTSSGGVWIGNVIVNSTGTLGGRGTISGSVTINSGGTYSPGNSPGIQTVGNLTFNSGSRLILEIDGASAGYGAGFHDQIISTGTVTINSGATLSPQTIFSGSSGFAPTQGQSFTVITSAGLTGQFSTIDNSANPSRLTFLPVYTSSQLYLQAIYSSLSSSVPNLTSNQKEVASALDSFQPSVITTSGGTSLPDNQKIHLALTGKTDAQLQSAIEQMNPEKLQAMTKLAQGIQTGMNRQIGRQLQLRRNEGSAHASIYDLNGQTVYEPVASLSSENLFTRKNKSDRLSFFTSTTGEQGDVKPSQNRTDFDYWSASHIFGMNYSLSSILSSGAFLGYGHSDETLGGTGGRLTYNTGKIGTYVSFKPNDWYVDGLISLGKGSYETQRNISFLSEVARGETESWEVSSEMRLGRDFSVGKFSFTPYILNRYGRTFLDAYDESNSAARLHVKGIDQTSAVSGAGINLQYAIPLQKISLVPRVYGIYEREWIKSNKVTARFAAGGGNFTVHGDPIDANGLTAGAGTSIILSEQLQFDLSYETEVLQNDSTRQSINLSAKFAF